ncbi:MAG TPA: hypothetical protein VFI95_23775 [Terriglobales bacterium]|nr:hypothetical protein [Terriglobales bacterium]
MTREEALQQFCGRGFSRWLRRVAFGPLHSVADFYIPFRVFKVAIDSSGKCHTRLMALESVTGSLDLYSLDGHTDDTVEVKTRNCVKPQLSDSEACEMVVNKVRRLLYSEGFFRLRDLRITAEAIGQEVHIPYWVAFRGNGIEPEISIVDAIRRKPEGAKVRRLLEQWLAETQA